MPHRLLIVAGSGTAPQVVRSILKQDLADCEVFPAPSRATLGELPGQEFDLVLLAWTMRTLGPDPLAGVRELGPVAVLSAAADLLAAQAGVQAGAVGFLPYGLPRPVLAASVRLLLAGGTLVPATTVAGLLAAAPVATAPPARRPPVKGRVAALAQAGDVLTFRELQVLRGIGEGLTNREIAIRIGLKEVTVKLHGRKAMAKLQAPNRTAAAIKGRELGLI
jgi:DNA-binding NarL/FixJ family response regulator